jgi:hypothetical protein
MAKTITVRFTPDERSFCNISYYETTSSGGLAQCLPELSQGDKVRFEVDPALGTVEVLFNFEGGSCFDSPGPFTVGLSGNEQKEQTVRNSAPKRRYLFTVGPPQPAPASPDTAHQDVGRAPAPFKGRGPHWETKTGDLEVVTEPTRK